MKKAVFYGRYSSTNQNEQSIEGQLQQTDILNKVIYVGGYFVIAA